IAVAARKLTLRRAEDRRRTDFVQRSIVVEATEYVKPICYRDNRSSCLAFFRWLPTRCPQSPLPRDAPSRPPRTVKGRRTRYPRSLESLRSPRGRFDSTKSRD